MTPPTVPPPPPDAGPSRGRFRRAARLLVAAVVAALVPALVPPAAADDDPTAERDRVREEQAANQAELDVLRASEADVTAELNRLAGAVSQAQAELANAERAVAEAEAHVARLDDELARLDDDLRSIRADLENAAVESYIGGGRTDTFGGLADHAPNDAVVRQALLDVTRGDLSDLLETLHGAEAAREVARAEAAEAREAAEAARDAAAADVAALQDARDRQQALAGDVEDRINRALTEAAILEEQDAALSAEIRARQQALARALAEAAAEAEAQAAAQAQAQAATPAAGTDDDHDDDSGPGPVPPTFRPPPLPEAPGGIVTVSGIQVAGSIAGQVRGLMDRAAADGVPLSGKGWRNPQMQIDLRRQNCGTSQYAIWQMPPTQCSPETAIPGTSNHERGLAIDFSWGGQFINSRSHPGFQWLAANAPAFGFANLPSEPWHWSIDGS